MENIVVSCPIDTYSGYGARARDFVKALIDAKKYDVKILSQRWGNTRFGYLADHDETDLASRLIPKLDRKPDIWIQITVPNEFQAVGKRNIGSCICVALKEVGAEPVALNTDPEAVIVASNISVPSPNTFIVTPAPV